VVGESFIPSWFNGFDRNSNLGDRGAQDKFVMVADQCTGKVLMAVIIPQISVY